MRPDISTRKDTEMDDSPKDRPRTPRWVWVLGIVALILILAAVAQLVFGIRHGPGMHGI